MIKNFAVLATRLKGIKVGDKDLTVEMLSDMMSKPEEFELSIPTVHILEDSELERVKTTVREEQKTLSYAEGKSAGEEMLIKSIKKQANLDFPGKDADKLVSELTSKIEKEKGVEPNKKIAELSESISNLQKTVEAKDNEIASIKRDKADYEKRVKVNDVLSAAIPENLIGLNKRQFITLMQNDGYTIDFTDTGDAIPMINGKPIKDAYEKPVAVESVVMEYAQKNKWVGTEGRGGKDDLGGGKNGFQSMNDLQAHMEKNNINPLSPQGQKLVSEFEAKTQA